MLCQHRHLFYWRLQGESHNASWHSSSCIAEPEPEPKPELRGADGRPSANSLPHSRQMACKPKGRCLTISVLNWRYTGPTCCVLSTCVFLSTCFVLSTLLCSLHMLCSLHIAWFSHVDFSLHVFSSIHMMCQQRHLFYWRFEGESHNASWHSSSCIADHWFP